MCSEGRIRAGGWTLVEMMVVLVLAGLLLGIVGPRVMDQFGQGQVSAAEIQVKQLQSALNTYKLDIGRYPTTEQGLQALVTPPADFADYWRGPYLSDEVPLDPWKSPYRYECPADTLQGFALYSLGSDGEPGGEGDKAEIGYLPRQKSD